MAPDKNSPKLDDAFKNKTPSSERLDASQLEAFREFRDFQLMGQILFQWEKQRLEKQLGSGHPRVRLLKDRLKQKEAFLSDIEVELEIARIKAPEAAEDSAQVLGRIFDEKNRGIAGLMIVLEDEKWQPIRFAGRPATDASGYFSFVVDEKLLKKLASLDGIYLAISTPVGRVVYRKPDPIKLAAGERIVVNVSLCRADLHPVRENDETGSNDDDDNESPAGIWTVRGSVTGAEGMPLSGLTVSLFDKDFIFDDRLGVAVTDEEGNFVIKYKDEDFRDLLETNPDLYVTVRDKDDHVLYSSRKSIRFEAGREEVIRIRIRNRKV